MNFLAVFVPKYSIFPLFGTKVTTVAMNRRFLTAQQLCRHRYIMDIRGGDFQGVHQPSILVHTNVGRIAEVPGVPLFVE